jgi:hypothetical protein
MFDNHRTAPRHSTSPRSDRRAWRPVFEALEPRAIPSSLLAPALGGGSLVARASGDAQGSAVGIHEISGAVIKINSVGDRQVAAGTAVSGRTTGIAADPSDTAVSAGIGQIWKTEDGGVTWSAATAPSSGGHIEQATLLPSVTDLVIDSYVVERKDFPLGLGTAENVGTNGIDAREMLSSRPGVGILKSMDSGTTFSRDTGASGTIIGNPPPAAPSAQPLPVLLVIADRDYYLISRGGVAADHVVCTGAPNGDILCIIMFD